VDCARWHDGPSRPCRRRSSLISSASGSPIRDDLPIAATSPSEARWPARATARPWPSRPRSAVRAQCGGHAERVCWRRAGCSGSVSNLRHPAAAGVSPVGLRRRDIISQTQTLAAQEPDSTAHPRSRVNRPVFEDSVVLGPELGRLAVRPAVSVDQLLHASTDLVADRSEGLERLSLGVLERPVVPLHTRNDWTLVAAPHCDQHRGTGSQLRRKLPRRCARQFEASVAHHCDHFGIDPRSETVPADTARAQAAQQGR
jgi:hypothetical protein